MSVVINGSYAEEIATTTLAAAQAEGLLLQYSATGVLTPATTRIDAVLASEIVTDTEHLYRYSIYQNVDYGPYTKIGEPSTVYKGVKGLTALGLLVKATAAIAAGVELELAAGVLQPYTSGTKVAVVIDPIAINATRTGQVHIY